MIVFLLIAGVIGYLLGALPFGFLVARAKGVNIFEVGSKSSGATNVRRVFGPILGNLVLYLDIFKGMVATGWPLFCQPTITTGVDPSILMVSGFIGALLGHAFSCFTHFRGGKSVATGAGGFLMLFPQGALVAAIVWGLTVAITRYVSLASILAGVALTITAVVQHVSPLLTVACVGVMVFVIIRHRTNISRLLAGTENKTGRKKPDTPA
ncbi:MAG: glycerol-3-phosphate 1-O-acyltransferase PlsY [Cephaloticoccus sp.]|nr:glycerol-3-phosphate 1-O-acyltransferase PlsY [Cephaloticoccus sp.]MCF7759745.1 glycerol-3-phosphate 1-O-acyltransferase PlsY [Cephaloticoccus sp.]